MEKLIKSLPQELQSTGFIILAVVSLIYGIFKLGGSVFWEILDSAIGIVFLIIFFVLGFVLGYLYIGIWAGIIFGFITPIFLLGLFTLLSFCYSWLKENFLWLLIWIVLIAIAGGFLYLIIGFLWAR